MNGNGNYQRLVLTQHEFEYVEQMLDYGSTMDQALFQIRPHLYQEDGRLKDNIILVHRELLNFLN